MAVAATNPGAFGKRGTLALVLFAILAFVGFLLLVGQGGLSGLSLIHISEPTRPY